MRILKLPAYLWVCCSAFLCLLPASIFSQSKLIAASSIFEPFTEEIPAFVAVEREMLTAETFRIQLGLFANPENVKKLIEKVKSRYQMPMYIFLEERKQKACYRILIGDFDTKEAAGDFIPELQQNGLKGILKKYNRWEDERLAAHP